MPPSTPPPTYPGYQVGEEVYLNKAIVVSGSVKDIHKYPRIAGTHDLPRGSCVTIIENHPTGWTGMDLTSPESRAYRVASKIDLPLYKDAGENIDSKSKLARHSNLRPVYPENANVNQPFPVSSQIYSLCDTSKTIQLDTIVALIREVNVPGKGTLKQGALFRITCERPISVTAHQEIRDGRSPGFKTCCYSVIPVEDTTASFTVKSPKNDFLTHSNLYRDT
ncbi:hypothetical protein H0H93_014775 [Arthromyces matolae]|nr:hypothetical protein H0H93_014775 [Arthromyces matolae]